jgi:nitrogen regulatory protein P-II 1
MFKKIKATIKPLNLVEVREALEDLGIKEVTISRCKNFGPQKGQTMIFRGKKQTSDFLSEIRLEMIMEEEKVGKVIEIIQKTERTAKAGNGMISILSLGEAFPFGTSGSVGIPALVTKE